jgi:hypothetical protein
MSVVSLAVLFVFGLSEMAMRAAPQQVDGYDGSQRPAISNVWGGDASSPKASIGATLSHPGRQAAF